MACGSIGPTVFYTSKKLYIDKMRAPRNFISMKPTYCLLILTAFAVNAHAALVMNVREIGGNVEVSTLPGGTINLDGLSLDASGIVTPGIHPGPGINSLVAGSGTAADLYESASVPVFGSGSGFTSPNISSGPLIGISGTGPSGGLTVPAGYTSGSLLAPAANTYIGQTFSSLGITPGSYIITWGSGPTADQITLNIGGVAVIPEPSTYIGVAGFGLIGVFLWRRRRARKAAS